MKKINVIQSIIAPLLLVWCSHINASIVDRAFFRVLGVVIVWGADNWKEDSGNAPIVSDFLLMNGGSGSVGHDVITGDVFTVLQNTLTPAYGSAAQAGNELTIRKTAPTNQSLHTDTNGNSALDANDSFSSFGLQSKTSLTVRGRGMSHSFYVASNVAFDIYALADNLDTSGDFEDLDLNNIGWKMGLVVDGEDGGLAFGGKAQNPAPSGFGAGALDRLNSMTTSTKVFAGEQRTALSPGSIVEHSVRFTTKYSLRKNSTGKLGYDLSMGKGHIEADMTYTIYVP
jgi:hypothetical protein